ASGAMQTVSTSARTARWGSPGRNWGKRESREAAYEDTCRAVGGAGVAPGGRPTATGPARLPREPRPAPSPRRDPERAAPASSRPRKAASSRGRRLPEPRAPAALEGGDGG